MSTPEKEWEFDAAVSDTSPPATPLPTAPSRRSARPLILRLHFYAGIFVAPFILVAAISGGLYAIAPTIEQFVYRDYLHVDSTGPAVPVAEQIRAAQQVRPDLALAAVRPAAEQGDTTRVIFTAPGLGESQRLAVFIDPATAQPLGELAVYGSSSALPMRTWIDQLHRSLHLGEPGRLYSELAASWLWIIALGGVYLWVDRYRRARPREAASARLLSMDRSTVGRGRTLSWHGVVGIWIAVGLVFLSATGLTWSNYAGNNVSELRSALNWKTPSVSTAIGEHAGHGGSPSSATGGPMNVDRIDTVLAVARETGIGGAVEASIPATADAAFTVAQTRQPWVLANNSVAVDGATGRVTDVLWFSDWPLAAKLSAWGIQLHMGILFGLMNQIVLVALAVALVTVIVRGYLMWWRRRPTRGSDWAVGRPPRRGGIRRIVPMIAAVLVGVAIAVGWFVPLLGVSLLAFVVVDGVLGAAKGAKIRAGSTDPAV